MIVKSNKGIRTHYFREGEESAACGWTPHEWENARSLPEGAEPSCARCRPIWTDETAKEATTPQEEVLGPVSADDMKTGGLLYAVHGLGGMAHTSKSDVVVAVAYHAVQDDRDAREIGAVMTAWCLQQAREAVGV